MIGAMRISLLVLAALGWCPRVVWGQAGVGEEATAAAAIEIREGFAVERVYSVGRAQGSWVAMCFDDRGRIYASDQGANLYRLSPPPLGSGAVPEVELVSEQWGHAQGLAFIQGALYVVQHGDHSEKNFRRESILRLRDTNGDDRLDAAETLFVFPQVTGDAANWYEHNVHAVVPGPDGKSIYVVSGDRNGLPCERIRTPQHWNRDSWDFGFEKEPYAGGWVMKADLEGKHAEVICMGLRNSYDLAFNREGDLFTYDSDLEHDLGLPNYRPTAIRQILSGTDSGWAGRAGEMRWSWTPQWEEIQPPLVNLGPGSPTGVAFGYGAKFPARYEEALYVCDWSYGRMFAVHLAARGASYGAEVEPFLSAQGLPIADVAVSPRDGALYFLTGGRGTQSGLYRVTYRGGEPTERGAPVVPEAGARELATLRRELEVFHGGAKAGALAVLWPQLGHEDRAIRGAARAALEWQPVGEWKERALGEREPRAGLQALLALARSTDGEVGVQGELLAALGRFDFARLGAEEQAWYLRVLTVSAMRHGRYGEEVAARLRAGLEASLPTRDVRVNEELVAVCAALQSSGFIEPTLDLLEKSRTQEEEMIYSQALVGAAGSAAWTPQGRERFFLLAADRVPHWKGGASVRAVREGRMNAIVGMLSEEQRKGHAEAIGAAQKPPAVMAAIARPFVKEWKLEELGPLLEGGLKQPRDVERGRALFQATGCLACHHFRGEGGMAGPDLSRVGGRYSARDLLDNVLNPSKVINEQSGLLIYTLKDGRVIVGRTVNLAGDVMMVATNPMDPGGTELRFRTGELQSITASPVSFMPEGLLNTLSQEEVLDLLSYLTEK